MTFQSFSVKGALRIIGNLVKIEQVLRMFGEDKKNKKTCHASCWFHVFKLYHPSEITLKMHLFWSAGRCCTLVW